MKIIDKILDNYCSKKLTNVISKIIHSMFDIDIIFCEDEISIVVKAKKRIFNDKQYKQIYSFYKDDALSLLCNQNELKHYLIKMIEMYDCGEWISERTKVVNK